jgi:hypothetical protein
VRLRILSEGTAAVLLRYGSDDLFYFTVVAANIAAGKGVSFDGEHPTSGIQPLFAFLLVPFAPLFQNEPGLALRIDLGLVTLLTLAAGLLIPGTVERLMAARALRGDPAAARRIGILAGCLWMLHPRVLDATFEGTEGALAGLCLVLSLRAFARDDGSPSRQRVLGAALGAGMLARVDGALVLVFYALSPPPGTASQLRRALRVSGIAALIFVPWLLFAWKTTGSFTPDSAAVKRVGGERIFALRLGAPLREFHGGEHPLPRAERFFSDLGGAVTLQLFRGGGKFSRAALVCGLGAAALVLLAARLRPGRRVFENLRSVAAAGAPLLIAAFALIPIYGLTLYKMRMWYLVPAFLGLTLLSAAFACDAAEALELLLPAAGRLALPGVSALWLLFVWLEETGTPPERFAPSYIAAAGRAVALTPEGARVGAFNAGVLSAWLTPTGRRVVNLDGVVNHSAAEARRDFRLRRYIREERLDAIVDYVPSVEFFERTAGPGLMDDLALAESVPVEASPGTSIGIYRVRGRDAKR